MYEGMTLALHIEHECNMYRCEKGEKVVKYYPI